MAEGVRVHFIGVLLLCFFINVFGGEIVKVAELYCRDPDDGSFHRVNTTWSSTTFCGNYTCHIRRKNHTVPAPKSTTSLNPIDLFEADLTTAGSEHIPSVAHGKRDFIDKQEKESDAAKNLDLLLKSISDKEDRYLNEEEIKTITKMLHTIKKSDLETIVEIYTLAKDILKEIDKEEEMNNEIAEKIAENCKHDTKNKLNTAGLPITKDALLYEPSDDTIPMKNEASRHGAIVPPLKPKDHIQQEAPMIPLSEKVPYYYPMSGFQRSHSYIHHHNRPQKATSPRVHPPLKKKMNSSNDFIPSAVPNPFYDHYVQAQRQMVPISLLPYPYPPVNQQHAYSQFNPYNLYNPQMYHNVPTNTMAQTVEIPKNLLSLIFGNIAMKNDDAESSAETKPIQKINPAKEKLLSVVKQKPESATLPKWQTKELSNEILNEIKANVLNQKKMGLLPIKKMGRLEKVGKAIKIEDLGRKKRNIVEKEEPKNLLENEYEIYLEKITCPSLYEPGYFQVGDKSKAFPSCCPRKLEKALVEPEQETTTETEADPFAGKSFVYKK